MMLNKSIFGFMLLAAGAAQAESAHPLYAGLVLQSNTLKVTAVTGYAKYEPVMTGVTLGYEFADYFALEGRALQDSNSDEIGPVQLKVNSQFQLHLRAHYPVLEQVRVYTTLSHVRSNYEMHATPNGSGGHTTRFSQSGAGYAAGIEYLLAPQWRVAVEQQWLPEEDLTDRLTGTNISTDAKALTFSASYAF